MGILSVWEDEKVLEMSTTMQVQLIPLNYTAKCDHNGKLYK
jgi:hypothetical protein